MSTNEWPDEVAWSGFEAVREIWANHTQNGTLGWWRVQDWKRGYLVKASSATEAFSMSRDRLANPSTATVEWIGEELPDVIEATE